jgi:hypothetical protein
MTTAAMASIDDEHITEPIAMPRSERARARDAAEPWLGHGPRIPTQTCVRSSPSPGA